MIGLYFSILTIAIIILFVYLWIKRIARMTLLERYGIPGPKPHFIFGNMKEFFETPNVEFHSRLMEKYGPIVGYYLGSKPLILVKHIGILGKIQKMTEFCDRPRLVPGGINPSRKRSQMLGNLDVNKWNVLRKKLSKGFTPNKLKLMVPLMNESIGVFIQRLRENENMEIDFYEFYQKLTLDLIGKTAFGVDSEVQTNENDRFLLAVKNEFVKSADQWLIKFSLCFPELFSIIQPIRKFIEFIKDSFGYSSTSILWKYCAQNLKYRRMNLESSREDLLKTMITANLSDDIIIANSVLFFEAAFETLSASLAFITHFLLNDCSVKERICDELTEYLSEHKLDYDIVNKFPLMDSVIAESLRLYPPQTTFISRCNPYEDFKYNDEISYIIPKGIQIKVALTQLHRDEENFPDSSQFMSDRFLDNCPLRRSNGDNQTKWQAFGEGPRHCIGQTYSVLVLKLVIARLLSEYKLKRTAKTAAINSLKITYKTATMTPTDGVFGKIISNDGI